MILYVVLFLKKKAPTISTGLAAFMMVALIFTHTIAALCLSLALLIGWGTRALSRSRKGIGRPDISLSMFMFFTIVMISCWIYTPETFSTLSNLVNFGFMASQFQVVGTSISKPMLQSILDGLGMSIFFAIAVIGFLIYHAKGKAPARRLAL